MGKYSNLVDKWGEQERGSAMLLTNWLYNQFKPTSVVDIGCGSGVYLSVLFMSRCDVLGTDYEENARNLLGDSFMQHDLTKPLVLPKKYDLAMSVEVIEHIDKKYQDIVVKSIADSADTILFSGAKPGQVGENHINCRTRGEWLGEFAKQGVELWIEKTAELLAFMETEEEFKKCPWLAENLMILRRVKWEN